MANENQTTQTTKRDNKKDKETKYVTWCEAYNRMLKGEAFVFADWSKTLLSEAYVFVPRGQTKPMLKFVGKPAKPFAPSVEEVIKTRWLLKTNKGE